MKKTLPLITLLLTGNLLAAPVCTISPAVIISSHGTPYFDATCNETIKSFYFYSHCGRAAYNSGWVNIQVAKNEVVRYMLDPDVFEHEGNCTIGLQVKDTQNKTHQQTKKAYLRMAK